MVINSKILGVEDIEHLEEYGEITEVHVIRARMKIWTWVMTSTPIVLHLCCEFMVWRARAKLSANVHIVEEANNNNDEENPTTTSPVHEDDVDI